MYIHTVLRSIPKALYDSLEDYSFDEPMSRFLDILDLLKISYNITDESDDLNVESILYFDEDMSDSTLKVVAGLYQYITSPNQSA